MKKITVILSHQLFENNPAVSKNREIYLVELDYFFSRLNFHKQKIAFHKSSMKFYQYYLEKLEYKINYITFEENLFTIFKKKSVKEIHMTDLIEKPLEKYFKNECKKNNIAIKLYKSPYFLSSEKFLEENLSKKDSYYFASFYRKQRINLEILIDKNKKPTGGKWSYDNLNRQKLPKKIKIPKLWQPKKNKFYKEGIEYTKKHFKNNPGILEENILYPVKFSDTRKWLDNFLEKRLLNFGTYEDAIDKDNPVLFHSILSPLLNSGLLTPEYVLKRTMEFSEKNNISLNNLEGFIRQLIGWREYVYGVYKFSGNKQQKSNFFKHKNKLPQSFWNATTSIEPIDNSIIQIKSSAYAHHIIRLMVLGNFMLLCQINPNDVYKWFMELFIDSYDWVMIPNVYGMSQYADGGLITTKPYISSSNYIKKMSNYKSNDWSKIWDGLYWRFIYFHKNKISKIGRLKIMTYYLERLKKSSLKEHLKISENFLEKLL